MGRKPQSEAERQRKADAIIDAAGELFTSLHYDEIKVSQIASLAKMAKGTVFLYFPSKDDIFRLLSQNYIRSWFDHFGGLCEKLIENGNQSDVEQFLGSLWKSIAHNPQISAHLNLLLSRIAPILEDDELEDLLNFQLEILDSGAEVIESFFPYLEKGTGNRIFSRIISMISAAQLYSQTWMYLKELGDVDREDPLSSRESPQVREEGDGTIHLSGISRPQPILPELDIDFYIHSVRRILKGYSLQ